MSHPAAGTAPDRGQVPILVLVLALLVLAALVWLLLGTGSAPAPAPAPDGSGAAQEAHDEAPAPVPFAGEAPALEDHGREVAPTRQPAQVGAPRKGRAGLVTGTVLDPDGKPLEGARVVLTERVPPGMLGLAATGQVGTLVYEARTDRTGRYRFRDMVAGKDYDMWVQHADYAPKAGPPVAAREGEEQEMPPVRLEPGYRVLGTVTDTDGRPLGATVTLRMQANRILPGPPEALLARDRELGRLREVQSDPATGAYLVDHLGPGVYTLRATAPGHGMEVVHPVVLTGGDRAEARHDLRLGAEFPIAGVVVDDQGQPVADVRIAVSRTRPRSAMVQAETVSGPDGRFELRGLPSGTYALNAMAADYSNTRIHQVEAGRTDLEVVMHHKGGVTGRVVDAGGRPVTRFAMEVFRVNPGAVMYGYTGRRMEFEDPNGNYLLPGFDPGTYRLLCRAEGFAPTWSPAFRVDRDTVRGIDVTMVRGGTLRGVILSAATGRPLAGAEVVVHGPDYQEASATTLFGTPIGDPNNVPRQTARTGADGRFVLTNVTPERLKLEFAHPTHLSEYLVVEVAEGADEDVGTVRLREGGVIVGVAYDEEGRPLAGGTVSVTRTEQNGGFFSRSITLDAQGRFRVAGLRAGVYEVAAYPARSDTILFFSDAKVQVTVSEGQVQEVEIRMP